jgi:hypothetical protein
MRTDVAFGGDMAMTTSCDLDIGITSGFLHGYNFTDKRQMEFIKDFLEINARFIGHPMVLVGLFTELQYRRHQSIHERLQDKYVEKSMDARAHISSINASHSGVGEHIKITQDVLGIVEKALQLDLSNLPRHLNILMKSVEDIGKSVQDTDARKYGARLRIRLEDMSHDYRNLAVEGTMVRKGCSDVIAAVSPPILFEFMMRNASKLSIIGPLLVAARVATRKGRINMNGAHGV